MNNLYFFIIRKLLYILREMANSYLILFKYNLLISY